MVGTNRLWAVRYLGWSEVPAIVTGPCPWPGIEIEDWPALRALFRDGSPYLSAYGIGLEHTTPPELMEYPA